MGLKRAVFFPSKDNSNFLFISISRCLPRIENKESKPAGNSFLCFFSIRSEYILKQERSFFMATRRSCVASSFICCRRDKRFLLKTSSSDRQYFNMGFSSGIYLKVKLPAVISYRPCNTTGSLSKPIGIFDLSCHYLVLVKTRFFCFQPFIIIHIPPDKVSKIHHR